MVYYSREYEEENRRQKKRPGKIETPARLLDLLRNSLRKKCPEGHRWKGMGLLLMWKGGGISSRIALRHLSNPRLHVWSAKDHTGEETALWGVSPRGWTLKTIRIKVLGVLYTSSHPNYTRGTPGVSNCGANQSFFFWILRQISLHSLRPLVRFPPKPLP